MRSTKARATHLAAQAADARVLVDVAGYQVDARWLPGQLAQQRLELDAPAITAVGVQMNRGHARALPASGQHRGQRNAVGNPGQFGYQPVRPVGGVAVGDTADIAAGQRFQHVGHSGRLDLLQATKVAAITLVAQEGADALATEGSGEQGRVERGRVPEWRGPQ